MDKLTGKTVLITGGTKGLGRAYAIHLGKMGANVGIMARSLDSCEKFTTGSDLNATGTVIDELKAMGVKVAGAEADISNEDQVFAAVKKIADELGDISILICNAGGGMGPLTEGKASEMDLDIFRKVVETNYYGTVYTVSAVAPMMKKNHGGKIVTTASIGGQMANYDGTYAHYSSSKAAIIHYTRLLANELGAYNINVNCIAPGFMETERLKAGFEKAGTEKFLSNISLGRFGTVKDCSNAIEFLVTDMSDYVTGTVLEVNGGTNNKIYVK